MEWQYSNFIRPSFAPPSSEPFPDMDMIMRQSSEGLTGTERSSDVVTKKTKLTRKQQEVLEKSFGEEGIRLDGVRKMKLSMELGLRPRQVAVWFQNRRSRWKAKQLERSYESLKLQLHAVSMYNHRLQDEVNKLRAMLMGQAGSTTNTNQIFMDCTQVSGGHESVAAAMHGVSAGGGGVAAVAVQQVDDLTTSLPLSFSSNYWDTLPAYPY